MAASAVLVIGRIGFYAAAMQLAGIFAFLVFIGDAAFARAGENVQSDVAGLRRQLHRAAGVSLGFVLVFGAIWLIAQAARFGGRPLADVFEHGIIGLVLTRTRFGLIVEIEAGLWLLTAIIWLASGVLSTRNIRHRVTVIALCPAAAMLGLVAWGGHGDDGQGVTRWLHLTADIVHLLAAGTWLGGLLPLMLTIAIARRRGDREWAAIVRLVLWRFSSRCLVTVSCLFVAGLINTWFLVGTVPALIGTSYGQLLTAKIALFVIMVAIAYVNRERLIPLLSSLPRGTKSRSTWQALRLIQNNTLAILGLGVAVLAIVGVLGTMAPGQHQLPVWPLSFRLDIALLFSPDEHGPAILASLSVGLGLVLATILFVFGRPWWRWLWAAIILIVCCLPALQLLTVPAYPTSYWSSPTGDKVSDIVIGQRLFTANCVACHGATGRGDGPQAAGLADKPADLAAAHIYAHSDGDLYWWISHGIAGSPMPGFADTLDETARWNLIDFIHANADGVRWQSTPAGAALPPLRAPDFTADCPDGGAVALSALKGNVVRLVIGSTTDAAADPDIRTIVIAPSDPAGLDPSFCMAPDADATAAYTLINGRALTNGEEFLIDSGGWLRARWQPGDRPDWNAPGVLGTEVARIRRPIVSSPPHAGHHGHG